MNPHEPLSVEEASRLAVTATVCDLEYWAHGVAVDGQVSLLELVRLLDALRDASIPQDGEAPALVSLIA